MGLAARDYKDVNNGSLLLGGKNGFVAEIFNFSISCSDFHYMHGLIRK